MLLFQLNICINTQDKIEESYQVNDLLSNAFVTMITFGLLQFVSTIIRCTRLEKGVLNSFGVISALLLGVDIYFKITSNETGKTSLIFKFLAGLIPILILGKVLSNMNNAYLMLSKETNKKTI